MPKVIVQNYNGRMAPIVLIVLAELLGTSLWFVGTAVAPELSIRWQLTDAGRAALLTSTQLGFIAGTLGIALTGLADRYRTDRFFAVSAFAGAVFNGLLLVCESLPQALAARFAVGLCLAGIYPLGMKLVVSFAPERSGLVLGWLVGALTLGTATPFLLRGIGEQVPWRSAIGIASGLAFCAGLLVLGIGEGPHAKSGGRLGLSKVIAAFRERRYRASALAYFGHMWELYAFWAMVPFLVASISTEQNSQSGYLFSFVVVALGGAGCVFGGYLGRRIGSAHVAGIALFASAAMCFLFPLVDDTLAWCVLGIWGFSVVMDSPQFSAISSMVVPRETVGSALAVQNGIGFTITIVAIQLTAMLVQEMGRTISWILLPGPLVGLIFLLPLIKEERKP